MPALLPLGRQFQRHHRAPEPTRCDHDRSVAGAVQHAAAYKKRMGWNFTWVSSSATDFNFDYHASFAPEEVAEKRAFYNFTVQNPQSSEREGVSVFYQDATGCLFHTYSTYARGIDMMNVDYQYLDLVPKGRDEGGRGPFWVRRHDEYGASAATD
jgi:predicted dithiol-disulfide oxidoreductase (DUF899 family)